MVTLIRRFLLLCCGAAVSFGGAALAERHDTPVFSIDTPEHWDLREVRKGEGGTGTWMFGSPSRQSRLLVHVGQNHPGTLGALFDRFADTRLRDHVRGLRVSYVDEIPAKDGVESAVVSFYGVARRVEKGQVYKLMTYVLRPKDAKRTVYLTLMATEAAWGRHALRFGKFIDSFELKSGGAK